MQPKYLQTAIVSVFLVITQMTYSQGVRQAIFRINPRFSFYSTEKSGEFLLHVPETMTGKSLSVTLSINDTTITTYNTTESEKIVRIPFVINLRPSEYIVNAEIRSGHENPGVYIASTNLTILGYKPNEVKTDRLTGGLIVNKRPFFPFGFYTYSPVDQTLAEEEIVRGFNMMSPYQKIMPESIHERKAYMDRCAQLGMKVHYNLLSVSGGGGVGSNLNNITEEEKRQRLIDEISAFRDHPALLGWYIADEPNGYKIPPAKLEEIYSVVRKLDPWHPVSIVFMAPFTDARKYENSLDIVMADPYPLPDLPVTLVGNVADQLKREFTAKKPVWIVPQAFGGGELWSREPTHQELRSMTWQAIVRGATGIKYFVRQGPNYFPKSPSAWAECGRMAMEVAELTPWLLSEEKPMPVSTNSGKILVTSKMHDGKLAVIVVNKYNEPAPFTVNIKGINNAKARSIFENRQVSVVNGKLNDNISPYGSLVYIINATSNTRMSTAALDNLLIDPGFEDLSSPGVPSACYVRPGGDNGATYFIDSREHYEGDHSLRLYTPDQSKSVTIRFFPVRLKAGATYTISIMAKSDPEQRFHINDSKTRPLIKHPQYVEVSLGEFSNTWFVPGNDWRPFVTSVTIPDSIPSSIKANLVLKMPGQGVAWFDQVRIVEEK